jgi:diguanylate cyclase (GGDEF)-like protein/PAS domain S-box-containing protein
MDGLSFPKSDLMWARATVRPIILTTAGKPHSPIAFVNPAFTDLTGYTQDEAIDQGWHFLQGPDTDTRVIQEISDALSAGISIRREILNYRKNGEPFWNDLTLDPIFDATGRLIGHVGILNDSTAGRVAQDARMAAELQLQNIVRHLPGYVYRRVLTPSGDIEMPYLSPSINEILAIPQDIAVSSTDFFRHLHPEDYDGFKSAVMRSAADLTVFREEFRLISTMGTVRWFRSDAPARRSADGGVYWDGLAIDITAEKMSETEIAFLAFHDSLTGLGNRVNFKNSLNKAIESAPAGEARIGVFFIDVDAFQEINTTLGQAAGDNALRKIGRRLTRFAGAGGGMVARLGGDEFAVLLPVIASEQSIDDIAASICREIARPMKISSQVIIVQVCVGAAVFPNSRGAEDETDASVEVMKQADLALRAAKQLGPGAHLVYAVEFDDRLRNRLALRQSLHRAVEGQQFELHYQPLVQLASGNIVGAEALVRWNHPELGMQRPDVFVPLAESSGLIVPLGAWAIKEAMRQAQAWKRPGVTPPRIAINISSIQLTKPGFIAAVENALGETGADPHDFEFELTEGLMIEPSPETMAILYWLKSLGFLLTIDDFGTGYSTFKYIRDFPVDKIKIDQTFVRQLVIDSSDASIIRAMITLSRSLGIQIVAEGIETKMQRDFLRDEGCEVGQGYLFSLPLAAEDFGWLLRSKLSLPISSERMLNDDRPASVTG